VEFDMMGYWYNGFDRFGHMGFGGWGMMLGGFLLTVLFVVLAVVLIRNLVRHGRHHGAMHGGCCGHEGHVGHEGHEGADDSALRILNERYVKGEIGDEEYAKKKAELKK
jgi:putative membrane protein